MCTRMEVALLDILVKKARLILRIVSGISSACDKKQMIVRCPPTPACLCANYSMHMLD